jgi:uncharacterized protein YcbK (DUF882 family)
MISKSEFTCKCGCGKNLIKDDVVELCNEISRSTGIALTVNSGYRCAAHNSNIGGEKNSQHVLGNAADLTCANMTKLKIVCRKMWSINKIGGLGTYTNFVHIDKGPHRSWSR